MAHGGIFLSNSPTKNGGYSAKRWPRVGAATLPGHGLPWHAQLLPEARKRPRRLRYSGGTRRVTLNLLPG